MEIYPKTKQIVRNCLVNGLILANLYGIGAHFSGETTGHVSSDVYLGKASPTYLEKGLAKILNVDLSQHTK